MITQSAYTERLQNQTRRPSTPGEVASLLLEELNITQSELAERLGVGRQSINELLRGRRRLTPDMAQRLGRFFGNGAGVWFRMQIAVDLWDALHMDTDLYQGIMPLQGAS